MKEKKPLNKKLILNRRTIADLSADEMRDPRAGAGPTEKVVSCYTCPAATCPPTTNEEGKKNRTKQGFCITNTPFCPTYYVDCD